MARKNKEAKAGRVSMQDLMSLVNKKAGRNVAHDLTGDNPTEVRNGSQLAHAGLILLFAKGK